MISSAQSLSEKPYIWQVEEYLTHLNMGHRRAIEEQHKIIYRVDEKNQIVYVTDIFDTRQDPSKMKG